MPLLSSNVRHYFPTVIADYEGIATATWSFINAGFTPSAIDLNLAYHHFVVANAATDSYSAILPPVRWSPMAPASDGGTYDGWNRVGSLDPTLRTFNPIDESPHPRIEVAQQVVPSDSHCDFAGYTQVDFSGDLTIGNVPVPGSVSTGRPNITALAPTTLFCNFVNSVWAWQFVINGVPTGELKFGNVTALRQDRLSAAKGDVIEIDIWYRSEYAANPGALNAPGKGFLAVNLSFASTGAPVPQVIRWKNINRTPSFDFLTHTYEVTISGHSGWTLKNGSNGPHKIINDGLWTRSAYFSSGNGLRFGSGLRWMYGSSFATLWIRTDSELPFLVLQPGSLVPAIFGYNPGEFYYYRPRNGVSSSYRKSTSKQATYNQNGTVLTPAETVFHAPSGVWAQGGMTTFDRIAWNNNLFTYVPGQAKIPGPVPDGNWVPQSITLTRVNL